METYKAKILIIEDEKPMVRAIQLKLAHAGYDARIAHNGEEGMVMMKKEKFDLVLLDLIMPRADGFMVLEYLDEAKDTTPVIVLTNLSQQEDEDRAKELGAREFLVKSNTPIMKVIDHIEAILAEKK